MQEIDQKGQLIKWLSNKWCNFTSIKEYWKCM